MLNKKEILKLSVSKTKTFIDCKRKFKFNYIDRLPRKIWGHHTFGTFCHKVLEDFHLAYIAGVTDPYNKVISQAFRDAWKEYGKDMTPEMKREAWQIIDQYLRIISKGEKFPNVIACEQKFELLVDGNILLNGMIDRVQVDDDDVIHVCDYKTTKNKKYIKNDFFQLLTYAYVMLNEDQNLKKVRASYILLRHDFEYITEEFTPNDILKIKEQYIEYAKQIRVETEFAPKPTFLRCKYCDYFDICTEGQQIISPSLAYGEVKW